jgi:hypothetical protein
LEQTLNVKVINNMDGRADLLSITREGSLNATATGKKGRKIKTTRKKRKESQAEKSKIRSERSNQRKREGTSQTYTEMERKLCKLKRKEAYQ